MHHFGGHHFAGNGGHGHDHNQAGTGTATAAGTPMTGGSSSGGGQQDCTTAATATEPAMQTSCTQTAQRGDVEEIDIAVKMTH
jgi:hypothetical protein